MKNVAAIKSSKTDSPKTPGGISRSLLTPCRRLGLSRNFRKSGASPFQSPLSSKTEEKHEEKAETRKRKESLEEPSETESVKCETVVQTPTRNVSLPRRKRSKTLLTSINKSVDHNELPQEKITVRVDENIEDINVSCKESTNTDKNFRKDGKEIVSPLVRLKSRSKKKLSPSKSVLEEVSKVDLEKENLSTVPALIQNEVNIKVIKEEKNKEKQCPNNLTKECIVVIQKKIFKQQNEKEKTPIKSEKINEKLKDNLASQVVFNDSDSDDVPLIHLNSKTEPESALTKNVEEDDDFTANKAKIKSTGNAMLSNAKSPVIKNKNSVKLVNIEKNKPSNSQSSVDDDDDFFEKKKTILIRKNYNKVIKPQRAKSTGSITQKDVDDLKARIEIKKKMLLARAKTEDTKELRDLIKKWQKGCQEALMELMDLMRNKFPEKQNMDYSEILQTLKIPASLVGYDSDNDCFLTPNDENIILANVKD